MMLQFFGRFKSDWRLRWFLIAANMLGIVYGYYFYYQVGQFNPGHKYEVSGGWWPFVSDSPNAVLLMTVSLLLWQWKKRNKWLDALAFIHMLYVGLWTTFLFMSYAQELGTWEWGGTNNILFFSHMGMPLEALVLLPDLIEDAFALPGQVSLVVWGAFNVYVDYWGPHIHPAPYIHPSDATLHAGAPWLMVATLLAYLIATSSRLRRRTQSQSSQ